MMDSSCLKQIEEIERAVEEDRMDLSEWEDGFVTSVKAQVLAGYKLSGNQEAVLTEIWERIK